jgi:hypothetical protein
MQMNHYGARARDYVRDFQPARYALIEDPQRHFAELGSEIEEQVIATRAAITRPPRDDSDLMTRMGDLNMALLMAEERVMAELVFSSPPEQDPEEPEMDETGAYVGGPPGWEPLPITPGPPTTDEAD